MRANNLTSNVNVAIDEGLWYLHKTMQRYTVNVTSFQGGWDNMAPGGCGFPAPKDCDDQNNSAVINASNVTAFEVNGHLETGPASDPYTDDVARGLRRMVSFLQTAQIGNKTIPFAAPPSCAAPPCTYN